MINHQFRHRLQSGELLAGTMITLGSPEVAELLAGIGFDWFFLDAEHGAFEMPHLQRVMQAAGPAMPCLVRLSATQEMPIKKALDAGAAGIIAPMVNSAEEAERVVRWSRYAPLGARGVGLGRAHGYGLKFQEYIAEANQNITVIVQIEHIQAVQAIEAIIRVAGVDGVLVGPYDLSASMGRLGEVTHPEVTAAIARVTEACQATGMPLGVFGLNAQAVRPYIDRGYTLIAAGVDTVLLGQAAQALRAQLVR